MSLYTIIISNCSGVARDYLSKNKNSLKKRGGLASPSGFADHQGRHLFGFDLAHVVFDTAFMARVDPYIVVNILHWVVRLKPFFE